MHQPYVFHNTSVEVSDLFLNCSLCIAQIRKFKLFYVVNKLIKCTCCVALRTYWAILTTRIFSPHDTWFSFVFAALEDQRTSGHWTWTTGNCQHPPWDASDDFNPITVGHKTLTWFRGGIWRFIGSSIPIRYTHFQIKLCNYDSTLPSTDAAIRFITQSHCNFVG